MHLGYEVIAARRNYSRPRHLNWLSPFLNQKPEAAPKIQRATRGHATPSMRGDAPQKRRAPIPRNATRPTELRQTSSVRLDAKQVTPVPSGGTVPNHSHPSQAEMSAPIELHGRKTPRPTQPVRVTRHTCHFSAHRRRRRIFLSNC